MKDLRKVFSMLLIAVGALSLASCLDDDDNNDYSLTEEQYSQYMYLMAGSYSGKSYFWNDTITTGKKDAYGNINKTDSFNVNAIVSRSDSVIMVNVPVKYLGKSLDDEKHGELKAALDRAASHIINIKFYLYQLQNNIVYFGAYPAKTTFNVNYGGEDHELSFNFYNYTNLNGVFYNSDITTDIYISSIELDKKEIKKFNLTSSGEDQTNALYRMVLKK